MVLVGFWRPYFGLFPHVIGLPRMAHFHAMAALLWFALLIAQSILIKRGNVALYRQVGKLSYIAGGIDTNMTGLADLTFSCSVMGWHSITVLNHIPMGRFNGTGTNQIPRFPVRSVLHTRLIVRQIDP